MFMFASKMEAKASAASQDWSPPGANIGTNFRGQCGHISWTLFTYQDQVLVQVIDDQGGYLGQQSLVTRNQFSILGFR